MKRTGRLTMVFTTCQVRASRLLVNLISFFSLLLFVFRLFQFLSPVVSLRHFRRTSPLPSLYVKLPSHRYIFRCVCVCALSSVCVEVEVVWSEVCIELCVCVSLSIMILLSVSQRAVRLQIPANMAEYVPASTRESMPAPTSESSVTKIKLIYCVSKSWLEVGVRSK